MLLAAAFSDRPRPSRLGFGLGLSIGATLLPSPAWASAPTFEVPSFWLWTWTPGALLLGLVLFGFLLQPFAPRRKKGLRHAAVLYLLYLASLGAAVLLEWIGSPPWHERALVLSGLLEVLVLINLLAIAIFDLLLPACRVRMAYIVNDVFLALGYGLTALWLLHQLGVNISNIVATSAVVTAVLGLALQPTLGNLVSGIALQLDESIHVGDWIELEGKLQGQVREIRWRHTVVETRDWDTIIVPNATLLSQSIRILGKREGEALQHRQWVFFNVDFRYAPGEVIRVVDEALQATPVENVASEPRPHCICLDLAKDGGESYARYAVRFWLTDLLHDDPKSSAVRSLIYAALQRGGIPLAIPAGTVFLSEDNPEHDRRKQDRELSGRLRVLDSVTLFASLTPEEKAFLAPRMRHAPYSRGEIVTRQGATAHWLYVLAKGEVDMRIGNEGGDRSVTTLTAPSFFGEMGLLTGESRVATVVALADIECYRIDKEDLKVIVSKRPEMAQALATVAAQRRVELLQVREGLDAEARRRHLEREGHRILAAIEEFFGLGAGPKSP